MCGENIILVDNWIITEDRQEMRNVIHSNGSYFVLLIHTSKAKNHIDPICIELSNKLKYCKFPLDCISNISNEELLNVNIHLCIYFDKIKKISS